MKTQSDLARRQALLELIAREDPFDGHRKHRLVLAGRADRHNQVSRLAATYLQAKLLEMREAQPIR